ncbi:hypothetical protein MTO96_017133 [Rhipicephalus appendiculatus]
MFGAQGRPAKCGAAGVAPPVRSDRFHFWSSGECEQNLPAVAPHCGWSPRKYILGTMSMKRKALSFKEKLDILKKVDEDPKRKRIDVAKELGLASSTLSTIVGQRDEIMRNMQRFSAAAKKAKTAQNVKVEEALLIWFGEVTAAGVHVDGQLLREKTSDIALSLGVDSFQASGGWTHRFKARHGLAYRTVSGEDKKVDDAVVSD